MELATITLRLSGQTQNTVVKQNVSPAQAAIYQYMHGEDCIESLEIISIDKSRTIEDEKNRLSAIFISEHSQKVLSRLFPGHAPKLPATFAQVGIAVDQPHGAAKNTVWQDDSPKLDTADSRLVDAIRSAAIQRQTESPQEAPPVYAHNIADQLDNTGDDEFNDDPLDAEILRLNQGNQG